jgi:hypothetical protein
MADIANLGDALGWVFPLAATGLGFLFCLVMARRGSHRLVPARRRGPTRAQRATAAEPGPFGRPSPAALRRSALVTSHKVVVARIGMRPLDSREPHRAIVLKVRRVGHHSPKNTPSPPRSVSAKQAPQPTGKGRMGLTLQPPRSP